VECGGDGSSGSMLFLFSISPHAVQMCGQGHWGGRLLESPGLLAAFTSACTRAIIICSNERGFGGRCGQGEQAGGNPGGGSTLRDDAQGGTSMGRMVMSSGSTLRDGTVCGGSGCC
jgi:hypothetical protein